MEVRWAAFFDFQIANQFHNVRIRKYIVFFIPCDHWRLDLTV